MVSAIDPKRNEIWRIFADSLHADLSKADDFDAVKPFLAHYTSLDVLEKILNSNEVWFSNPLLMNDLEEVRFGIFNGAERARTNSALSSALKTDGRRFIFQSVFQRFLDTFVREHSFDTYVLCFTQHEDPNDHDGLLSMWRGYGGNGRGAAIVFDTSKLGPAAQGTSLILAKVHYASATERLRWIDAKLDELAALLRENSVPDDMLYLPAGAIFQRLKLFALFTKHKGFQEEREWRAVYRREEDPGNLLGAVFGYLNGPRGIEPKLRFSVKPVAGMTVPNFSLDALVTSIILGPTMSSPLALASAKRMVSVIRPELVDRVFASSIPFRPS